MRQWETTLMRELSVAVVGGGPRGFSILERLVTYAGRSTNLNIHLIDPGGAGQGSHSVHQARGLLTNTLASQVTIYPLRDFTNPTLGNTGPSFTDWANDVGYRRIHNSFKRDPSGAPVSPGDYLPRALLGEYLASAYQALIASLPSNIVVEHHRNLAVDFQTDHTNHILVELQTGYRISVDYLFLATGHCANKPTNEQRRYSLFVSNNLAKNPKLGIYQLIYPTKQLDDISSAATVAVQGLGLTGYDVISSLTEGRGGVFVDEGPRFRYIPSGAEPKILIFSRNCLPYAARGINQKGLSGSHHRRFFTPEAIELLRRRTWKARRSNQLDFCREVLPLLQKEMIYAYRSALVGHPVEVHNFEPTPSEFALIDELFTPAFAVKPTDFTSFRANANRHIADDLAEAKRGNLTSPLKAATDVIRDARDALSAAVEYRGLTPESHRIFFENFVPCMNRISFGPPLRRNGELLALIEAGIVDWAGGPGCAVEFDNDNAQFSLVTHFSRETTRKFADVFIMARLPIYRPEEDAGALSASLLRRGLIRPYFNGDYHPCGMDIDMDQRPLDVRGNPLKNVWVVGYPTEGARFYTHALPRPFRQSAISLDADKAVRQMFEAFDSHRNPPLNRAASIPRSAQVLGVMQ
jgi:uncharacterized NAD(P)/FAD-binding protein YdhS